MDEQLCHDVSSAKPSDVLCGNCVSLLDVDFRGHYAQVHRSDLRTSTCCRSCGRGSRDVSFFWQQSQQHNGYSCREPAPTMPFEKIRGDKEQRAHEFRSLVTATPDHPLHHLHSHKSFGDVVGRLLDEVGWDAQLLFEKTRCEAWLKDALRHSRMEGLLYPAYISDSPVTIGEMCPVCLETCTSSNQKFGNALRLPCNHSIHLACLGEFFEHEALKRNAPPPYGCPARLANGRVCGVPIPLDCMNALQTSVDPSLGPRVKRLHQGLSFVERCAMPWVKCSDESCGWHLDVEARDPVTGIVRCLCGAYCCGRSRCAVRVAHPLLSCTLAVTWFDGLRHGRAIAEAKDGRSQSVVGIRDRMVVHLNEGLEELEREGLHLQKRPDLADKVLEVLELLRQSQAQPCQEAALQEATQTPERDIAANPDAIVTARQRHQDRQQRIREIHRRVPENLRHRLERQQLNFDRLDRQQLNRPPVHDFVRRVQVLEEASFHLFRALHRVPDASDPLRAAAEENLLAEAAVLMHLLPELESWNFMRMGSHFSQKLEADHPQIMEEASQLAKAAAAALSRENNLSRNRNRGGGDPGDPEEELHQLHHLRSVFRCLAAVVHSGPAAGAQDSEFAQVCIEFFRSRGLPEAEVKALTEKMGSLLRWALPLTVTALTNLNWKHAASFLQLSEYQVAMLSGPPVAGRALAPAPIASGEAERLSALYLAQSTRACPSCNQGVSKNAEDCNTTYCPCGASFCWLCLRLVREADWSAGGHSCARWGARQEDFQGLRSPPRTPANESSNATLVESMQELAVNTAADTGPIVSQHGGKDPGSAGSESGSGREGTFLVHAGQDFRVDRWREEERQARRSADISLEASLEVILEAAAQLQQLQRIPAGTAAQLDWHIELLKTLAQGNDFNNSFASSNMAASSSTSDATPSPTSTSMPSANEVISNALAFLLAQKDTLLVALEQAGKLTPVLQRWESMRALRDWLRSVKMSAARLESEADCCSACDDDQATIFGIVEAAQRMQVLGEARRAALLLENDPIVEEAHRSALRCAVEYLREAEMWLTGLDCLSALPESVTGMAAALRSCSQEATAGLRRSAENLCRVLKGLACLEPGDPRPSPWAPAADNDDDVGRVLPLMTQEEAREHAHQSGGQLRLPILGQRVCLSSQALRGNDTQGHLVGECGVVVAVATLRGAHLPESIHAWRDARATAAAAATQLPRLRSPVLVESATSGETAWYAAEELFPAQIGLGIEELSPMVYELRRALDSPIMLELCALYRTNQ